MVSDKVRLSLFLSQKIMGNFIKCILDNGEGFFILTQEQIYTSADVNDWICESSIKLVWLLPPVAVIFLSLASAPNVLNPELWAAD